MYTIYILVSVLFIACIPTHSHYFYTCYRTIEICNECLRPIEYLQTATFKLYITLWMLQFYKYKPNVNEINRANQGIIVKVPYVFIHGKLGKCVLHVVRLNEEFTNMLKCKLTGAEATGE